MVHDKSEAIVLTGTTGESPNLTQDDREIIYKTAKDSVGDKVKLIAGTGTYSTKESIENSRIAEDLGIPVNRCEDPLSAVVVGSGICLERFNDYNSVLKSSPKPN